MNYSEFLLELSKLLRTSSVEAERLIINAPHRYKHYKIPKRNGELRDIHHPSPALKAAQRWIANDLLSHLQVHDCVFSYRKGRNIAMHAAAHIESNYIVRLDFSNFFPSITGSVVRAFLLRENNRGNVDFDARTIEAIIRIACRYQKEGNKLVLSIGAPSSPHLSNVLLHSFDELMSRASQRRGGTYTRYADDIYISSRSKEVTALLEADFFEIAAETLPYLKINRQKTQHLSRKRRMSVTGVNITPQRRISIGRDAKRSLKTRVFLALQGTLPPEDIPALKGMLAHVAAVEPAFIAGLGRKYGIERIEAFLSSRITELTPA